MEFNWTAASYREIVNNSLGYRNSRRPRGIVKKLAAHLRCHSTFIAQVLSERAHFSFEQGLDVCGFFNFADDEREYFLTLLARDRAGTPALRKHHQHRLNELLEKQRDLKPKAALRDARSEGFEGEYFANWSYQAIHALTQIERYKTPTAIAEALQFSTVEVIAILNRLQAMSLVDSEKNKWTSLKDSLHLEKGSPHIRALRATWKAKILADLYNNKFMDGTRYAGIITVSDQDYQKVRDILIEALRKIRQLVEKSKPEAAHILSIDCYKMD
jgi:Domain of unknown function (DUF4423)